MLQEDPTWWGAPGERAHTSRGVFLEEVKFEQVFGIWQGRNLTCCKEDTLQAAGISWANMQRRKVVLGYWENSCWDKQNSCWGTASSIGFRGRWGWEVGFGQDHIWVWTFFPVGSREPFKGTWANGWHNHTLGSTAAGWGRIGRRKGYTDILVRKLCREAEK